MRESPRIRRLRNDLKAIEQLRADSSILDFVAHGPLPESYLIRFYGKGLWRPDDSLDVVVREHHEMTINLSAAYPRMMPELAWKTPIFHPNISAGGVVCLGGYGTHWVPSVRLDELLNMLWDMIRYENFDVESPYNREAAAWARTQATYRLPIDSRPLRDRVAGMAPAVVKRQPPIAAAPVPKLDSEMIFFDSEIIDAEIIEAEVVEPVEPDILYIE